METRKIFMEDYTDGFWEYAGIKKYTELPMQISLFDGISCTCTNDMTKWAFSILPFYHLCLTYNQGVWTKISDSWITSILRTTEDCKEIILTNLLTFAELWRNSSVRLFRLDGVEANDKTPIYHLRLYDFDIADSADYKRMISMDCNRSSILKLGNPVKLATTINEIALVYGGLELFQRFRSDIIPDYATRSKLEEYTKEVGKFDDLLIAYGEMLFGI